MTGIDFDERGGCFDQERTPGNAALLAARGGHEKSTSTTSSTARAEAQQHEPDEALSLDRLPPERFSLSETRASVRSTPCEREINADPNLTPDARTHSRR
jgi:hypothetical protein